MNTIVAKYWLWLIKEDSETESLHRQRAGSKTYKMYITAIITR